MESLIIEKGLQFKKEIHAMQLEQGKYVTQKHIFQIGKIANGKVTFKPKP